MGGQKELKGRENPGSGTRPEAEDQELKVEGDRQICFGKNWAGEAGAQDREGGLGEGHGYMKLDACIPSQVQRAWGLEIWRLVSDSLAPFPAWLHCDTIDEMAFN